MKLFRSSISDFKSVVLCLFCVGLLPTAGRLQAQDDQPSEKGVQTETEKEPGESETDKADPEETESKPKSRELTREERRERLLSQARNGLGSSFNLIGIPQIQSELGLSEAQQKEIADQTKSMVLYLRMKFKDVPDLPRDQQPARMRELELQTRSSMQDRQKNLLKVLNEEQRKRLLGISIQLRGPKSLLDEEVIELLELTAVQVELILDILEEHHAQVKQFVGRTPAKPEQPLVLIQSTDSRKKLDEEVEQKILAVLSGKQREKFKELQGEPFATFGDGRLPTLLEPEEKKTLQELVP